MSPGGKYDLCFNYSREDAEDDDLDRQWMRFIFHDTDEHALHDENTGAYHSPSRGGTPNMSCILDKNYMVGSLRTSLDMVAAVPAVNNGKESSVTSLNAEQYDDGISQTQGDPSSLALEPQLLVDNPIATQGFVFARPKLFVGKRSETTRTEGRAKPIVQLSINMETRRRPKKRTSDGRPNIKSIPMYNGDPIEDFEEGYCQRERTPEPGLFPVLEIL
jgi:hypothetical protein